MKIDDNGDRSGYESGTFSTTGQELHSSVAKYIVRLGLYLHRYDELFNRAKRLPGSDSKMAAIIEVSKLISFCVCL